MNTPNVPTPEVAQESPQFTAEIQSRLGNTAFYATGAAFIGFDGGFFGSRIFTEEIPTNFMYGGYGAVAAGALIGVISFLRHR